MIRGRCRRVGHKWVSEKPVRGKPPLMAYDFCDRWFCDAARIDPRYAATIPDGWAETLTNAIPKEDRA